jgi:tetratricopeptide (TPR) repeat protein
VSRTFLKRFLSGVGVLVIATAARAQAAKMYGVVTDESGQGVPDVKIILEPIAGEDGAKVQVASKGKKGAYFFGLIRPGTYSIKVDSPGNALLHLTAKGTVTDQARKAQEWSIDGRVNPDQPTKLRIEDAMDVKCDIVVGKAMAVPAATGGGTTSVTADQAYASIAQQVQKGDCAGALPQVDTFISANPEHGRAYYLKGFCSAVLEKNDEAIAALQKSVELDPTFAGSRTLLGKVYIREGKFGEAETVLKQELENASAAPEVQVDAWLSLGGALREQKKTADAAAAFEKAIELAPSRPEAYVELSSLYADSGDLSKAEAVLGRAKDAGADDPQALLHVAISYFNKKDNAHAEAMCRRVIEGGKASPPDLASAYAILGRIQLNAGKMDDGVASLKKSLELDPKGRFAEQTTDILKALKKL